MRRRYTDYQEGQGSVYDKSRHDNLGLITRFFSSLSSVLYDAPLDDAFYVKKEQCAQDRAAGGPISSTFR